MNRASLALHCITFNGKNLKERNTEQESSVNKAQTKRRLVQDRGSNNKSFDTLPPTETSYSCGQRNGVLRSFTGKIYEEMTIYVTDNMYVLKLNFKDRIG